jgi:hypothetical protein
MTVYLIHSLPLLMSAVQIFTGDQMAVVAHLVGLEQIGYESELGMNHSVSSPCVFHRYFNNPAN